jgi:hypothetical protein
MSKFRSQMSKIQQEYRNSPESSLGPSYTYLRRSYRLITHVAAAHVPHEHITEDGLMKYDVVAEIWMESLRERSTNSRTRRGALNCIKRGLWGMCRRTLAPASQSSYLRACSFLAEGDMAGSSAAGAKQLGAEDEQGKLTLSWDLQVCAAAPRRALSNGARG